MDKLVKYELSEKILYCPVEFNNQILKNQPSRGGMGVKLEESTVINILKKITENNTYFYILDFGNIDKICLTNETIKKIFGYKNLAIYFNKYYYNNNSENLANYFNKNNFVIYNDDKGVLIFLKDSDTSWMTFFESKLTNEKDIIKKIHAYLYMSFFLEDIENNKRRFDNNALKYLESSNVYINCYINVKALFLNTQYLKLIISDLTKIIINQFTNLDRVCLLGVSNNGIILSHLLAYQLHLDVKSINHLGPRYCLDSDGETIKEIRNKRFILISDVICLGGEYRLAKGILNIMEAKLLGGVCVVKIRDVYRNKEERNDKILSLVDNINTYEINESKVDYKIYIDEEKLKEEEQDEY